MNDPSEMSPTLFLAWREAKVHRWFVIGRLRKLPGGPFEYVYTRDFESARARGLQPLLGFEDLSVRYLSESLFPQFANRIMSPRREEYATTLARLGLNASISSEPLTLLALTEGHRKTDPFVMFAMPRIVRNGQGTTYEVRFFVNGIAHVPQSSQDRASQLRQHDPLFTMWDWQNPSDERAVLLRTEDNHCIGWVPRYYAPDLQRLRTEMRLSECEVIQANPPPAPTWQRLLVELKMIVPEDFLPLSGPEYQPIPEAAPSEAPL